MRHNLIRFITLVCMLFVTTYTPAFATDALSSLLMKGEQQWKENKLDEAQNSFEQAVKANPKSVEANAKLAGLLLSRNDFKSGIQSYQRLIGLDPKNTKAWLGLGISYMHTSNNALSLAAFEEAIRLDPSRRAQLEPVLAKLRQN